MSEPHQEQELPNRDGSKLRHSTVVQQTSLEQRPKNKGRTLRVEDFGKTSYQFKDLNTLDILLFALFSVLLVFGGAVVIVSSIRYFLIGTPFAGLVSFFTGQFLFLTIGVLLLTSPIYIDRFILRATRHEKELRERAQNATREAGLLQDVLTHDIRNYNQVLLGYANEIGREANENHEVTKLASDLLSAVDKSTIFVDRAKMLGKIISDHDFVCKPTDLLDVIRRSFALTQVANPDKRIIGTVKIAQLPIAPVDAVDRDKYDLNVKADDLLNEAFLNLFSNSVKFTQGDQVFIALELTREYDKPLRKRCWKISVTDVGEGIPDGMKVHLFSRYTNGAKEAGGLGMSIVHALVSGRYGGRIQVKDRVESDYSKGALIEIWLPRA